MSEGTDLAAATVGLISAAATGAAASIGSLLRPGIISALSTTDGSEKWHIQGDLGTLNVYDDKVVLADDDIQAYARPGEHRAQQGRTGQTDAGDRRC
ncbi:hypothetical protein ACFXJO_02095 [Streptomyces lavendulae]|uniref:hypothetical protein n=1 Tax=Streptomyces lavendulae TaxID=1914 RepID=UPI0036CCFEDA